jgi:hypothetical protein
LIAAGLLVLAPGWGAAGDLTVSGGTVSLGGGTNDLDCGSLTITNTGTYNGNTGTILLGGNWDNQGTFNPGTSTVTFTDDCGPATTSTITGSTDFYNFIAITANGHILEFESGETQSILNDLVLQGADGQLLVIRSTVDGSQAFLVLNALGTQTIGYVDVKDNNAAIPGQYLAPGSPAAFNSVDSGNNFRWFLSGGGGGGGATPIPAISGPSLVILLLLLPLMTWTLFFSRGSSGRRS